MASTFIAHSSFALPREEDIDLASLLITDSAGQEGKIRPLLSKGSPSRMASYTSSSSSPARKAANTTGGRPLAPARNNDLPMSMPPRIPGGGEGARIPPANGHSLFDSTSDASHSARNVTGNQHARSGLLGARNKYVGTDASPPSSSELFVCRESFLVAADFCKAISETLGKIERAVDRDGVFDTKVGGRLGLVSILYRLYCLLYICCRCWRASYQETSTAALSTERPKKAKFTGRHC